MATVQEFREKVKPLLQDGIDVLGNADIEMCLELALSKYSKVEPIISVDLQPGDDGYSYDLPSAFVDGFSSIKQIEYPYGEQDPVILDKNRYEIYQYTTGKKIRFLDVSPNTTEEFLVTFTVHWTTTNITSIIDSHVTPIVFLCASLACKMLATYYSQTNQVDFANAEFADLGGKDKQYEARAKSYQMVFDSFFGLSNGVSAAYGIVDYDSNVVLGYGRFTHPKSNT
jgi:hypothetical protein